MNSRHGADPAAGWLTDRPFQLDERGTRLRGAVGASLVSHLAFLLLLLAFLATPELNSLRTNVVTASLSYVQAAGHGRGGGGGNEPRAVPAPTAEPATPQPEFVPAAVTPLSLSVTSQPLDIPGTITGLSAPVSLAPAGGGGTQPGPGGGDGAGPGAGPGSGGNTGGDEYQPGDNVTIPVVIFEKRPAYTLDALRAKIQGIVEIEAVVLPDGTVARPRIVRSLDRGLDLSAVEAVREWRFKPGKRRDTNQPVSVVVRIQLTFLLR